MAKQVGVTLSVKARSDLRSCMRILGNAKVSKSTGFSINTLKSASGGFPVHQSTAKVIESWLGDNRTTCKETT